MFAHVDEHDADCEGQRQVLGKRRDRGVDSDATSRQVDLDASLTRRHLQSLHLVLAHLERALLTRVHEVDVILHATGADLALTANNTHVRRSTTSLARIRQS